jgi:hypothetical protein
MFTIHDGQKSKRLDIVSDQNFQGISLRVCVELSFPGTLALRAFEGASAPATSVQAPPKGKICLIAFAYAN